MPQHWGTGPHQWIFLKTVTDKKKNSTEKEPKNLCRVNKMLAIPIIKFKKKILQDKPTGI